MVSFQLFGLKHCRFSPNKLSAHTGGGAKPDATAAACTIAVKVGGFVGVDPLTVHLM